MSTSPSEYTGPYNINFITKKILVPTYITHMLQWKEALKPSKRDLSSMLHLSLNITNTSCNPCYLTCLPPQNLSHKIYHYHQSLFQYYSSQRNLWVHHNPKKFRSQSLCPNYQVLTAQHRPKLLLYWLQPGRCRGVNHPDKTVSTLKLTHYKI